MRPEWGAASCSAIVGTLAGQSSLAAVHPFGKITQVILAPLIHCPGSHHGVSARQLPGSSDGTLDLSFGTGGMTTIATGSDMGGSVRIPSAFNGGYGFKPPFGRISSDVPEEEIEVGMQMKTVANTVSNGQLNYVFEKA